MSKSRTLCNSRIKLPIQASWVLVSWRGQDTASQKVRRNVISNKINKNKKERESTQTRAAAMNTRLSPPLARLSWSVVTMLNATSQP